MATGGNWMPPFWMFRLGGGVPKPVVVLTRLLPPLPPALPLLLSLPTAGAASSCCERTTSVDDRLSDCGCALACGGRTVDCTCARTLRTVTAWTLAVSAAGVGTAGALVPADGVWAEPAAVISAKAVL